MQNQLLGNYLTHNKRMLRFCIDKHKIVLEFMFKILHFDGHSTFSNSRDANP